MTQARSKPLISLVVATVDRTDELQRCLLSLNQSTMRSFEVIVVDQNEDFRLDPIISDASAWFPLTWLRVAHRNAAHARNMGAVCAGGEWIGFPDDDCRFLPETLERLERHIAAADTDVLAGMTRDQIGRASVLPWHPTEAAITRHRLRRTVAESTMYLRNEIFFAVSGFDPAFGPGSVFGAEEGNDLIRRLWQTVPGVRMRFFPDICFIHDHPAPCNDLRALEKTHTYARARGACFARHWRSTSVRRVVNDLGRHVVGSIVFRGIRRRSRILSLVAYVEGFVAYQKMGTQASQHCEAATPPVYGRFAR